MSGAVEAVEGVRRFRPYPEYKDSGSDWLGDVPTHWSPKVLKRCFRVENGATPKSSEAEHWNGEIVWATPDDLGDLDTPVLSGSSRHITEQGYKNCGVTLVPAGSLVLSTRAPIGHLAIAGVDLCTNQGCRSLVPNAGVDSRFSYYQLHAARSELASWGQGSTFKELAKGKLEALPLVEPPLPEQRAIAEFLDRETGKIDALVAKKERLIELLQEKRTALITHAVTKGLDPTAPTKPSGIDWLGDIPAHWEVLQVRRVLRSLEQGWSPSADDREADVDEWAVIKLSAIHAGHFDSSQHKALPAGLEQRPELEIRGGDVLLTRANTPELVGDACLVGSTRGNLMLCDLAYRLVPLDDRVDAQFFVHWFLSLPGRRQIKSDARGSSLSMVKISQGHIKSWLLPLPPLDEQRRIGSALAHRLVEIDSAVETIRVGVERLNEFRTALISAAVTGKIDVREAVA